LGEIVTGRGAGTTENSNRRQTGAATSECGHNKAAEQRIIIQKYSDRLRKASILRDWAADIKTPHAEREVTKYA